MIEAQFELSPEHVCEQSAAASQHMSSTYRFQNSPISSHSNAALTLHMHGKDLWSCTSIYSFWIEWCGCVVGLWLSLNSVCPQTSHTPIVPWATLLPQAVSWFIFPSMCARTLPSSNGLYHLHSIINCTALEMIPATKNDCGAIVLLQHTPTCSVTKDLPLYIGYCTNYSLMCWCTRDDIRWVCKHVCVVDRSCGQELEVPESTINIKWMENTGAVAVVSCWRRH